MMGGERSCSCGLGLSGGAVDGGIEWHAGTEEHAVYFAPSFGWEFEEREGEILRERYWM